MGRTKQLYTIYKMMKTIAVIAALALVGVQADDDRRLEDYNMEGQEDKADREDNEDGGRRLQGGYGYHYWNEGEYLGCTFGEDRLVDITGRVGLYQPYNMSIDFSRTASNLEVSSPTFLTSGEANSMSRSPKLTPEMSTNMLISKQWRLCSSAREVASSTANGGLTITCASVLTAWRMILGLSLSLKAIRSRSLATMILTALPSLH